jgi:sugar phosphate isomerase/epimerase
MKASSRRRVLAGCAAVVMAIALLHGSLFAAEKVVVKKYPDLKIGFTTQNYLTALPVTLENSKKIIDWAADQGFALIELRDPSAKLTLDECTQLSAYARSKKVEVAYALQIGILDAPYWETFSRGVANAAVFEGPKTIRTLIGGGEFAADPKKKGWNLKELYTLVKRANRAGNTAMARGVHYVVENGTEALRGNGATEFGTTEFFANVNSNVGYQMDIANFFAVSRVVANPQDAQEFLEKNVGKLRYMHLKSSSRENKTTTVLEENPLPIDTTFAILSKNRVRYVAIELPQQPNFDACNANMMKSIEFLKKNY